MARQLYKSEASALTESIRTHSPALIWWACWVECWFLAQRKQRQPKCIQTFSSFCRFSSSHSKSQHARGSRCVSSCIDLILLFCSRPFGWWIYLFTYPLASRLWISIAPFWIIQHICRFPGWLELYSHYVCVCDLALSRITVPISALVNYQKTIFLILKPLMNGGWVWT